MPIVKLILQLYLSDYLSNFSPLNSSIPRDKIPLSESLKDTYERVVPYYNSEISKNLKNKKNVLISAHGNSLRALCKYLFKVSDTKINELEIPTGNPLIIEFDKNLEIQKYSYLSYIEELDSNSNLWAVYIGPLPKEIIDRNLDHMYEVGETESGEIIQWKP